MAKRAKFDKPAALERLTLAAEERDDCRDRLSSAKRQADTWDAYLGEHPGDPLAIERHREATMKAVRAYGDLVEVERFLESEEARFKRSDTSKANEGRRKKTDSFLPEIRAAFDAGRTCGRVIWAHQRLADEGKAHLSESTIRREWRKWKEQEKAEPVHEQIARATGANPKTVERALKVRREASPEVVKATRRGQSVQIALPPPDRRWPVKRLPADWDVTLTVVVPHSALAKTKRDLEALGCKARGPLTMRLRNGEKP